MEDDTPSKGQAKESRCCHTYIKQADLKIKKDMRDKEGQDIMIKGTFHQEDITLMNICASNTGAPKYIKQLLTGLKGEINRMQ